MSNEPDMVYTTLILHQYLDNAIDAVMEAKHPSPVGRAVVANALLHCLIGKLAKAAGNDAVADYLVAIAKTIDRNGDQDVGDFRTKCQQFIGILERHDKADLSHARPMGSA